MRILFLPTVQHTGTWFLIEFLRAHPEVKHFVELQALRKNHSFIEDPVSGQKGLVPNQVNLIQGHFQLEFMHLILSFAAACPTVIPLRDPLASVLTAVNRKRTQGNVDYSYIVDRWVLMTTTVWLNRDFYKPLFVPLDLVERAGVEVKFELLGAVLGHMGLGYTKHAVRWADEWPYHNSRGEYPLKDLYLTRDATAIAHEVPGEWEALRRAQYILRPMLEQMGYRDLLWWD